MVVGWIMEDCKTRNENGNEIENGYENEHEHEYWMDGVRLELYHL